MTPRLFLLAAPLLLCSRFAAAQAPLAQPLADFDKLLAQLKVSSLVGEPVRAGDTTIIPFAKVEFTLAGGEAMAAFGGGMGSKTIPLGVLVVEGDDVRAELFPEPKAEPNLLTQIVEAVRDHKMVFMVNGLNIGNASGGLDDLAPLVSALSGQNVSMVNGLNLGNLNPTRAAAPAQAGSLDAAISDFEAAVARKPSANNYYLLGEILKSRGLKDKAAAAYRKALELEPKNAGAMKGLADVM